AATTLGLLSPTTTFAQMKIYITLLGVQDSRGYLGSLEFLDAQGPQMKPMPGFGIEPEHSVAEQIESEVAVNQAERADLVIMNPPFTRSDIRHDQFSKQEEKMLKAREKELLDRVADGAVNRSHNGNAFLALADLIAKERAGTIAVILPLVGATNISTQPMRVYLAKRFHIDTIVTSHDPTRIYFSENTNIGEMLLICRRVDVGLLPPPPANADENRQPVREPVDARRGAGGGKGYYQGTRRKYQGVGTILAASAYRSRQLGRSTISIAPSL
ncbi:MAG: hypothetical protein OXH48_04920, partial [Chloroflexi bacterium]|nr:hypothetical protein [Chloroflexota bacterium]